MSHTDAKQPINTHRRLFDLVRNCRAQLHEENLITSEEYAWLCQHTFEDDPVSGSPSPRRLEDYDDLREKIRVLEQWKREEIAIESWWMKIDEFVRTHPDSLGRLGQQVSAVALEWLRERDALKANIKDLLAAGNHLCDLCEGRQRALESPGNWASRYDEPIRAWDAARKGPKTVPTPEKNQSGSQTENPSGFQPHTTGPG
jgi:hypothetical protein